MGWWVLGWVHRIECKYGQMTTTTLHRLSSARAGLHYQTRLRALPSMDPGLPGPGTSLLVPPPPLPTGLPACQLHPCAASLPVRDMGWGAVCGLPGARRRGWAVRESLAPLGRSGPRINLRSTRAIFPGLHCGSAACSQSTCVCCIQLSNTHNLNKPGRLGGSGFCERPRTTRRVTSATAEYNTSQSPLAPVVVPGRSRRGRFLPPSWWMSSPRRHTPSRAGNARLVTHAIMGRRRDWLDRDVATRARALIGGRTIIASEAYLFPWEPTEQETGSWLAEPRAALASPRMNV